MSIYDALAIPIYEASLQMHPSDIRSRVRWNDGVIESICEDGGKITAQEVKDKFQEISDRYKVVEMLGEMLGVLYEALGIDPSKVVKVDMNELEKQLNENY